MELETLPEVQLVLLYTQVDGVHLFQHSSEGLLHGGLRKLHGTHPSLNGSQGLHYLRIIDFWLRRPDGLRGGSHIRKSYRHGSKHIVIRIISLQLCIGLHQSLLADRILNLHLWLSSNTDARLKNNLCKQTTRVDRYCSHRGPPE
jgi:hypothetical protein